MCFSTKYNLNDKEFIDLKNESDVFDHELGSGLPADFFPILKYFPSQGVKKVQKFMDKFEQYLENHWEEHLSTFDQDNLRDFTDFLIKEKQEESNEGVSLDKTHYLMLLSDMFFAGTDTTRTTLTWIIHYLVAHPEIQKKVQSEIDDVVGAQEIGLKHKEHLPYVYAVVHEALRIRPILPLALPHMTTCDTTVGGYEIPANTQILANVWAVQHSPKHWKDPEVFNPARFLDDVGKMAPKQEGFLPFSAGRRVCVGEILARNELHLLVAKLFQRYTFKCGEGVVLNGQMEDIGSQCIPKEFEVTVETRK